MRACEGCRRRKIKCDSATTNTWPCAACTRLKLQCIPPSVSSEKDSPIPGQITLELQKSNSYPQMPQPGLAEYQPHLGQSHFGTLDTGLSSQYGDFRTLSQSSYIEPPTAAEPLQYASMTTATISREHGTPMIYPTPQSIPAPSMTESAWDNQSTVSNLADAFGDLQIDLAATGQFRLDPPIFYALF